MSVDEGLNGRGHGEDLESRSFSGSGIPVWDG